MPRKNYVYRIIRWEESFENAQSRRYKTLSWVPLPNRFDGLSFRRLANHKEGVSAFCAWSLMVEAASKTPVRGVLADEKGAITEQDLSITTGFPPGIFSIAYSLLTAKEIAWVERIEYQIVKPLIDLALQSPLPVFFPEYAPSANGVCSEHATLERKKEKKGKKEIDDLSIWELRQKGEALKAIWAMRKSGGKTTGPEAVSIKKEMEDVEKRIAHYGK